MIDIYKVSDNVYNLYVRVKKLLENNLRFLNALRSRENACAVRTGAELLEAKSNTASVALNTFRVLTGWIMRS